MAILNINDLRVYDKWIGQTAMDVYYSVIAVNGWQNVFQGPLPRWASRVRQYFNLTPMTLKLLDHEESSGYLEKAQTALPASARAKARRNEMQSRGMGISFYAPGSSTTPGTPLVKPDPNAPIETLGGKIGTMMALSGDVYEDTLGRVDGFDQDEAECERDERAKVACGLLASERDALESFELADRLLDTCPCLVERFRKVHRPVDCV